MAQRIESQCHGGARDVCSFEIPATSQERQESVFTDEVREQRKVQLQVEVYAHVPHVRRLNWP